MEKATTPTLLPGNRNKGFTLMELIVVMIIIAVMSAIVYPSFKKGMESIKEQKRKAKLELLFKRALVQSRFDGKARILRVDDKTGKLIFNGKLLDFKGLTVRDLKMDNRKTKSLAILPYSFYKATIDFDKFSFSIDLYSGEVEIEKND